VSAGAPRLDVAVVGAGLAGLECAGRLAARGVSVLLADRRRDLGRQVHTTGIFVRRTLEDFPFPEDTLGPAIRHVTLWSPAGRRLDLESRETEFRVGRMGAVYRHRLAAAVAAGVEWEPGWRLLGITESSGGSRLAFDSPGGSRAVTARFVIGADGAASLVARELGLDRNREWIVGVEDVFTGVPLEGPPRLHAILEPRLAPGYIAWVAADGEEVHVGTAGYPGRFEPVAALDTLLAARPAGFDPARGRWRERRGGRIPVGGVLPRLASPRGLLVGDAAGAVSPLTAGGLDPCLRLSALAAEVTASALAGDGAALGRYAGHGFRARFVSRLWMRRAIAAVRLPALAELACLLLRTPPGRALAAHVFFGRGSFPDVGAEAGEARPGGAWLPAPPGSPAAAAQRCR
jgi:flavin-dependent dehydrogenase